jgi:hypothetical protein
MSLICQVTVEMQVGLCWAELIKSTISVNFTPNRESCVREEDEVS